MLNESRLKLAYLTGEYPKASHTFILREIAALRALGVPVLPVSVRHPSADNMIGNEEREEEKRTFYVLEAAKNPARLLAAHISLLRRPKRWFRALILALKTGRPGFAGRLWQLFYFLEAGVLAQKLTKEDITHLHNHFADSSANVAMITAELADIPFSFTLHGPAELFEPESWHLRTKIARAAHVFCISHFCRSQAMLFSDPDHWSKLRIIHCGIEPARYEDEPAQQQDGLRLLFVGRLAAIKGLRVLFESLEAVRKTFPDVTLTLIGDGEERAFAEKEAKRLGHVTLLGFQSQAGVSEALAKSDALVLPSFAEGVPVVLMEAMAAGKPVIATRVAGVSELVEDGVSGHLVPPGSPEHLTDAIHALAEDADKRLKMGQRGRDVVREDFDVTKEAARILAVLSDQSSDIRPVLGK